MSRFSSRKSDPKTFISKFALLHTGDLLWCACPCVPAADFKSSFHSQSLHSEDDWIYRALTFPCNQLPVWSSVFRSASLPGIGGAKQHSVLVKGSNYLETLAQTKYVI